MEKKEITIDDVANRSGYSKATVSKYLNNIPYVSEKAQKRIKEAIDELNFQPNFMARGLVNKSTKLLGLVISDFELTINMELIKAVETEAGKFGYNIILISTNDDEMKEKLLPETLQVYYKHLDGLILANARENRIQLEELKKLFKHIILVHRYIEVDTVDYVIVDGNLGGRYAAEYLIAQGHRNFGIITGPTSVLQFKDRINGFLDVLKDENMNTNIPIIEEKQTVEGGYRAAEKLITRNREVTAVFACSDALALGVLEASRHYGWEIPQQISVLGFDNILFSSIARVPLTTIDSRVSELGKKAVQLLLERIDGRTEQSRIILQPSLIVRETVKNIKQGE